MPIIAQKEQEQVWTRLFISFRKAFFFLFNQPNMPFTAYLTYRPQGFDQKAAHLQEMFSSPSLLICWRRSPMDVLQLFPPDHAQMIQKLKLSDRNWHFVTFNFNHMLAYDLYRVNNNKLTWKYLGSVFDFESPFL